MAKDDIGYPVTTNRAGEWGTPSMQHIAQPQLGDLIQPIQQQARQDRQLMGVDDLERKIMDIVNHDLKLAEKLVKGITEAVDASRLEHPSFIGSSREEHQISLQDQKIRFQWCVEFAQQARFDMKWSITRIAENLPVLLDAWLNGEFYKVFNERRKFWAKNKLPRKMGGRDT